MIEYTEEELKELKEEMSKIGAFLPDSKMSFVWSWYKRINNTTEPQPCSCASSGKHWKKAVDSINGWLNDK